MKAVVDSDFVDLPKPSEGAATAALVAALTALEAEFEANRPEVVVVADDSETALAAALVATKLLIPLEATDEAASASSANGRVLAQLAQTPT